MKIVNPLYDLSFKYLMQNDRIAKKVLSVLLECEVLELSLDQREIITVEKKRHLNLYRFDFNATIINEQGETQKVFIELQKSKLPTNLLRFRTYLGANYIKKDSVTNDLDIEEERIYPIISIYILGYNVVDIPYLAVNIDNKITNIVTKEEVNINSDFIDLLTHKTRVIQIRRLSEERRTRLEQFLMLFNQDYMKGEKYILDLTEIPEEFNDIADYLGRLFQDEDFRNRLKGECEIDEIFRNQEAELITIKQRMEDTKQQKDEITKEIEKITQQTIEAKQRANEVFLNQKKTMQIQFAKHLLQQNTPVSEISKMTGLDEKTILEI